MPIRPENRGRYPKNWKSEIVPRIRARSEDRCECRGECGICHDYDNQGLPLDPRRCGIPNGIVAYMTHDGIWHLCMESEVGDEMEKRGRKVYKAARIVLTVAHLNHLPEDVRDDNLLHMCQGCHNRYDAPVRRAGIQARAHAERAAGDLFCEQTG